MSLLGTALDCRDTCRQVVSAGAVVPHACRTCCRTCHESCAVLCDKSACCFTMHTYVLVVIEAAATCGTCQEFCAVLCAVTICRCYRDSQPTGALRCVALQRDCVLVLAAHVSLLLHHVLVVIEAAAICCSANVAGEPEPALKGNGIEACFVHLVCRREDTLVRCLVLSSTVWNTLHHQSLTQ